MKRLMDSLDDKTIEKLALDECMKDIYEIEDPRIVQEKMKGAGLRFESGLENAGFHIGFYYGQIVASRENGKLGKS